jgi:hypothetical protein
VHHLRVPPDLPRRSPTILSRRIGHSGTNGRRTIDEWGHSGTVGRMSDPRMGHSGTVGRIKMNGGLHERYFERREIKEAIAFAEAGGIAIHRNFDYYHGSTIRGFVREKPFLHIIGLRPVLEEWGRQHGLRPEWIQPEKRRKVAHYDVFGAPAEALIARLKPL